MAFLPCAECGKSISDRAFACPQCGAPTGRGAPPQAYGYEYRSKAKLFGLPLVHIATGIDPATGKKRIAKGIIALGDVAIGAFACGGLALGGFTVGGASLGVVSIGGMAVGILLGLGGMGVGYVAFGGLAIGYYACGGAAFGAHVISGAYQDPEAMKFFERWLGPMIDQITRGR